MHGNSKLNALVRVWLSKAEEDDLTCASLITHKDAAPAVACFHAQQMAEKYLKTLLVFHKRDFPKAHDLRMLATLLMDVEPAIMGFESEFVILNKYITTTRYPGDFPEGFSWPDAEEAYNAAVNIKEFTLKALAKI